MTTREKALALIHRYAHEVAGFLPAPQRADVERELSSLLEETLDERALAQNAAPTEDLAVAVLRQFGRPEAVALRYQTDPEYLIGPEWFPYFKVWSLWILIGLAGVFALAMLVPGWMGGASRLPRFLTFDGWIDLMVDFTELAIINLGLLALVFAVLERVFKRNRKAGQPEEEWNPRDLPQVDDPDRISEGGIVFKIYATVVLFLILNFAPRWFGVIFITDNDVSAVNYEQLSIYLPKTMLNIWWGLTLALNMWLLNERRWTRETRWMELGLGIFGAVIQVLILAGSNIPALEAMAHWANPEAALRLARMGNSAVMLIIKVGLVLTAIEAVVRLVRIVRRYPLTA